MEFHFTQVKFEMSSADVRTESKGGRRSCLWTWEWSEGPHRLDFM